MKKKIFTTILTGVMVASMGVPAFAASLYNKSVTGGTVTYANLSKVQTYKASAQTDFVPLNGNESYKAYVFLEARNSSGGQLNATQNYGRGYGTTSKPDSISVPLQQNTTSKWVSTHRSNKAGTYGILTISNQI